MKLKLLSSVVVNGAHFLPAIARIVQAAHETAPAMVDDTVWVTSANDGKHMTNSRHFSNKAFDIRIRNIKGSRVQQEAKAWAARIKTILGADYDIVVESDHLHVELDPKGN